MIGNALVAVTDYAANISPQLKFTDYLKRIANQRNGFQDINQFSKCFALKQLRDLFGSYKVVFMFCNDLLQFPLVSELFGCRMNKTTPEQGIVHIEHNHFPRIP